MSMEYGLFDSHAHIDDSDFDSDREELLKVLPDFGIARLVNIGSDVESSLKSVELSAKYDYIYAAVGIHPQNSADFKISDIDLLKNLIDNNKKVVAIGEIGLDYHYDDPSKEAQKQCFNAQMQLAKDLDVPVVLHIRDAYEDALEIMKYFGNLHKRGVVHCFSGSVEFAREVLKLGYYIGIGGVLTFKNAKKLINVANEVDIDNIVLETDCPYMAPTPFRGQRNDPSKVFYVAEKLAQIKNTTTDIIIEKTYHNANNLYGIAE